jgi:SAM-dependent methyltransferase
MFVRRARASLRYRAAKLRRRTPLLRDGDSMTMWQRQVMNAAVREILEHLGPSESDAIEVSGRLWGDLPWASYRTTSYPEFDLVSPRDGFDGWGRADVVICEQVLEHVQDPVAAVRNLVRLARPGGTVVIDTPFLVRLHAAPDDYWRFTPHGLELLMRAAGLEAVTVDSWGNRRCVRSNLRRWTPARPWRSLRDEADFPMVVWGRGTRPRSDRRG